MDVLKIEDIAVHWIDMSIIGVYLIFILVAGTYLTRLASSGIDSYFLGGRKIPWWFLGFSGTASWFDVTGVMWMIAFFYILGPRYMWLNWEWGALIMAFFAAYMAKWLRRSRVLTGAEWMIIRFGKGKPGETARVSNALLAVVTAAAMIGVAEYGSGRFLHMFIPAIKPNTLAIILMTATAVYTISAGLYGVVLTDVIQYCLILLGSFVLITKAITMSSYETVAAAVPADWFGFAPMWHWPRMETWEITKPYSFLLLMSTIWVVKGLLLSVGGPTLYDVQRFLAARSPRDASKAGMLWGIAMTPMFMVSAAVAVIGFVKWGGELPNPEHLYPVVIGTMLPIGIKGLVLAGLLSAFMSTFSSTVNAGAAYLVRDGYQNFLRPNANTKELMNASRICSALLIVAGIIIGYNAKNIDTIMKWVFMILHTAFLMPNILRWFWWRFNGQGYAGGMLTGIGASIITAFCFSDVPMYITFPILLAINTLTTIIIALLTEPVPMETLKDFYRCTRPAGWWGPVKRIVLEETPDFKQDSFLADALTVVIASIGLQCLFLASSYACTHQWKAFVIVLAVVAASAAGLYFTWYKHLPAKDEEDPPQQPA